MTSSPAPVLGVSVIIFRDASAEEILLVERGKEPLKGYWAPPGGRVEWGETIPQAAQREVMEECGITIHLPRNASIATADRIPFGDNGEVLYHFVLVVVAAIAEDGAMPQAGDDADACQWVRVRDLGQIQPLVEDLDWIIPLAKARLAE